MVSGPGKESAPSLKGMLTTSLEGASTTKIFSVMAAAGVGGLIARSLPPRETISNHMQSQAYMAAGSAALQSMTQSTDYTMGLFGATTNSLINAGHMIPGTFNGGMGGGMFGFDPMMGMGGMGMGPGMMNQNGMQGGIQIPPPTPGVAELVQQLQQQQRQIQQLQQQIQQQSEEHPKNDPEPEIVRGKSNEQLQAFVERLMELNNKQDNKNAEKSDRQKKQAEEVSERTAEGAPVRRAEGGDNAAKGAAPGLRRENSTRLRD